MAFTGELCAHVESTLRTIPLVPSELSFIPRCGQSDAKMRYGGCLEKVKKNRKLVCAVAIFNVNY